jgi:hypothetical protein
MLVEIEREKNNIKITEAVASFYLILLNSLYMSVWDIC